MLGTTKQFVLLDTRTKEGRGAWFDVSHRAALAKVAAEPGHVLVEAEIAKLDQLAPDFPAGKVNPHGKPESMPVVPPAVIDVLSPSLHPSGPKARRLPS